MIEGSKYIGMVKSLFSFLETEFAMKIIEEKERGNAFYDVQYGDEKKIVSVSYENIENYLQVIVFLLDGGKMPSYDDKSKTLHLDFINSIVMPGIDEEELRLNSQYFSKYTTNDRLGRALLKGAKELRLALKHFELLGN